MKFAKLGLMKKCNNILFTAACFLSLILSSGILGPKLQASEKKPIIEISCTHSQLCLMAEFILKSHELKKNEHYTIKQTIKISGDPHDFEPKASEIKELINSSLLISGPTELNPWIKKITEQRKKNKTLKSISLSIASDSFTTYKSKNKEALSHFWLYPEIQCDMEAQLEEKLVEYQLIKERVSLRNECSDEAQVVEAELSDAIKKMKYPMVFTHDALLPLFNIYKLKNQNFLAIKGSGHHHETTAASVKKLYDALKAPLVIWLIEENINVPKNILDKKRANDLELKIESAEPIDSKRFSNLVLLKDKIKALNE